MPLTLTPPATSSTSAPTNAPATSCAACAQHPGELLSRHAVSAGWVSYHRCPVCVAVRVLQTPRITWFG